MADERMLVFYLRNARKKAREAATAEALALLHDLDPRAPRGGPLSEVSGVLWITVPDQHVETAASRLPRLGYTEAVDLLVGEDADGCRGTPTGRLTRWKRHTYELVRLYEEDPAALRARAPDRRLFLFETGDGQVRAVQGYRGSNDPLTHRALPVPDARLLVNLVTQAGPGLLLDPFAGAGGIVLEALTSGWSVVSADIDPAVRHGLVEFGTRHVVADARRLPFGDGLVDAIATEPVYDARVGELVEEALGELHRVLRPGGRLAMLCAAWQAAGLRQRAEPLGLYPQLDTPVNRKGLDVVALVWRK